MFEIEPPTSADALRRSLATLHGEIHTMASALPLEEFHAPQGEHWSPAVHLRHLVTANRALAKGMATPKLLLALRFGLSRRPSRSYEEVREVYRAALAAGGEARGRWDPATRPIDLEPAELRRLILDRWQAAGEELQKASAPWSERALDRHQAKHPLLGKMTVRELLYFTLYHNAHHARRIVERSPSAVPVTGG